MTNEINHQQKIAIELGIKSRQVDATAKLLAEGATIPFIARYRKEATGLLDEIQIGKIRDELARLAELDKRRAAIMDSLIERELLTKELEIAIHKAATLSNLEDIYLPLRPKRRTKGTIAKEKGLEPLAHTIFSQTKPVPPLVQYINPENEIHSEEDALAGARDIIAEWISEDAGTRARLRKIFSNSSTIISSVVKKNEQSGVKFRDYFDWQEPASKAPGHRILALYRGADEKVLKLSIRPPEGNCLTLIKQKYVKNANSSVTQVSIAIEDSYKRLLAPSLENELQNILKEKADKEAIQVFAANLKELLLASPLGQKRVMALDPGFRTGAKLVCLDGQGKLLHFTTVYPTHSDKNAQQAGKTVTTLVNQYNIEAIAIGNGTAGRETEAFIRSLTLPENILITMVDESGASIYSASEAARAEFPDHDVTVRGAVSIGRRLQDPLSELVKIDPKSIGVGQYQHDVNQAELKKSLVDVVISCVNSVGVDLNTASYELLTFVSGLGKTLAKNIISHRNQFGAFSARKELLKIPRLGAKAFEQCAGFLRIQNAANPLDGSAVHPERYSLVKKMANDAGCKISDLTSRQEYRNRIKLTDYITDSLGLPTLNDIMEELAKPGRDPRSSFSPFAFAEGINSIEDLKPDMRVPGIITNVTKFGAFVDIGVHQDGLIHISQLSNRFVKDPAEIVKVRQKVTVRILEIDAARKRISLSLKEK